METSKAEVLNKQDRCQLNIGKTCHEGQRHFSSVTSVLRPHTMPGLSHRLTHITHTCTHLIEYTHSYVLLPHTHFVQCRHTYSYKYILIYLDTDNLFTEHMFIYMHTHTPSSTHICWLGQAEQIPVN